MKKALKNLLILGALVAAVVLLFSFPTIGNNLKARELRKLLVATELPKYAKVIASRSRVFNGGNGNGCDFQAIVVVSYYGNVAKLQSAYAETLEMYATKYSDPEIRKIDSSRLSSWSAKIYGRSTELSVTPNANTAGLYLIDLTVIERSDSFDMRCT